MNIATLIQVCQLRRSVRLVLHSLIHHNLRIPIGIGIHPCSIVLLHIDTPVATIAREGLVTARIVMRELCAGAKVHTPPGIVDEVPIRVIEDSIMNRGRRIPERRTRRLSRSELRRRFAVQRRPVTWQRGKLYPSGSDVESSNEMPILVNTHG